MIIENTQYTEVFMEPVTILLLGKLGALALKELANNWPSGSSSSPPRQLTKEEQLQQKYDELLRRYNWIDWPQVVEPSQFSEHHYKKMLMQLQPQEQLHNKFSTLQWKIREIDSTFHQSPQMPMKQSYVANLQKQYSFAKPWFEVFRQTNEKLLERNRVAYPTFPYNQQTIMHTVVNLKKAIRMRNRILQGIGIIILLLLLQTHLQ